MQIHQPLRVVERLVGMDGDRVHHHAGLEFLDPADFVRLVLDLEIAVDDADAAGLGHGDGEPAFGHRIHRRREQRNAERDLAGQARLGIGFVGEDRRGRRHQQDVVESERLADFHAASR